VESRWRKRAASGLQATVSRLRACRSQSTPLVAGLLPAVPGPGYPSDQGANETRPTPARRPPARPAAPGRAAQAVSRASPAGPGLRKPPRASVG